MLQDTYNPLFSTRKEKPPSERAGERLSQKPIIRLFLLSRYTGRKHHGFILQN